MWMKRFTACVAFLLCLCLTVGALAEYRTLSPGNMGNDVMAMKERLYKLGYYRTDKLNGTYNDAVCEVISAFQTMNALPATGIADAYTQAVMFSDAAVRADGTTFKEDGAIPDDESWGEGEFRTLKSGDYGDDVLVLKQWMYLNDLYNNTDFNNVVNAAMIEKIKKYQSDKGMEPDGIISADLQKEMSETLPTPKPTATPKPTNTPRPTATPKPTKTPKPTVAPVAEVKLPELDEEGYLADADAEPFVLMDWDDGHWYYIDQELHIDIRRYQDPNQVLIWYETEVICKPSVTWQSILAGGDRYWGRTFEDPLTVADQAKAILAITDDNFGYRWYRIRVNNMRQYREGVVIRDGEIKTDVMPDSSYSHFPPLDVMAYYPDGSIELYGAKEHNAQDYIDMGVLHTFAFGPILVRDGEINESIYGKNVHADYNTNEPRQAVGYYGPGHYLILTVKGRADDSVGATIPWIAEKLHEDGVKDAFNLDGGYTTVLYFMGEAVNKKPRVKRDGLREVSGVIGIGTRE